jgi:hypothetical protein
MGLPEEVEGGADVERQKISKIILKNFINLPIRIMRIFSDGWCALAKEKA